MVGFASKCAAAEGRWTVQLEEEGDDFILPLPPEFLEANGWQAGDTIKWVDNEDGTWQIINMRTLNGGSMSLSAGD
jgi:hypothetical protein